MNKINLFLLVGLLSSCTHTINFRTSHFATPVAGLHQWGGEFSGVFYEPTAVTLVNNMSTNPPERSNVRINQDVNLTNLLLLSNIGADIRLAPLGGLDLFLENSMGGFSWQFLNPGARGNQWVSALRAGYGSRSEVSAETSSGTELKANSDVTTTQGGLSVGYMFNEYFVPYVSYVYDEHAVKTKVTNQYGIFTDYNDRGIHRTTAIGITKAGAGLMYALEFNMINILWDRSSQSYQNAVGIKLGYAW